MKDAVVNVTAVPAFQDNYIWLIHDADNRAAIVDPGDAQPVLAALDRLALDPVAILVTHHHYDHIAGIGEILARYSIPVLGPAREKIPGVTEVLGDGDNVIVPSTSMRFAVLDVPGHTAGHIAFYGENRLFCGDTLFSGGCGRLFEGTPEQMYSSLQRIARLPDTTQVYCAHEYTQANLHFASVVDPGNADLQRRIAEVDSLRRQNRPTVPSTLADEKRTNPFLRCHETALATAASEFAGARLAAPAEVFAALRRKKDGF